ncbi:carboxypeptidase-like regulatory domain-containing protein [Pricia sp. S334]|uniref:Carboxypeptidase-like regulatory domain-containing protein n=1 Tax=Pricia mediterranea TaxID=3076079 RepID=A0ABU3L524_9FLAO|nr:carboxypeptidase-like regulatory domain-containing protein [Pricia sp. S334]MDT7828678.1 carboxypeptidase-like regulatory domain-containing protein [Pricia sp. S334]
MPHYFKLLISFIFVTTTLQSQSLSSVIIDSTTRRPVPYVTVQLNNRGMITNEEGRFTFSYDDDSSKNDTLFISSIGYESIARPISKFTDSIIVLRPKTIELKEVIVSNKNYTPGEIIEKVEERIEKNYYTDFTKKRVFLRETYQSEILKTDYTLRKSTIPAFNENFLDSVISTFPKKNTYYTEMLGDLYGNADADNQKLDLIKASEMYDKDKSLDVEILEEKFNQIVKANVKSDSYFKIKSGWFFGTKIDNDALGDLLKEDIDSTDTAALNKRSQDERKQKEERRKFFSKYKRETLGNLFENLPIFKDSDYNVLFKPRRYDLSLENFTYLGDQAVYVITFVPDGSPEFKGKLFINADDFALIRMDFENTEPLRDFKLLGVSIKEYLAKGSVLFAKGNDKKYHLRYYDVIKGIRAGVKRPLKIIEKNKHVKGRRKQNELSLKVDAAFGNLNHYELVVFGEEPINEAQFEHFEESNKVLPTYMPQYDPEFWKGHNIIEPNRAIKEFTSEAELPK